MGNLTATQLDAIKNGEPTRQQWYARCPTSSAHTIYYDNKFEEGLYRSDTASSPLSRITKAGKRRHRVWNPHPNIAVEAEALRYRFEVQNKDGKFNAGLGGYWNMFGIYDAAPQECFIKHTIEVWLPATSTWSTVTHMTFIGRVLDIDYVDGANAEGTPLPDIAVVTCEQKGIWDVFRRTFKVEDGSESMVDDATRGPFLINVV